jgi:hypothetical protein
MSDSTKTSGNGEVKPSPEPFKIERSLMGIVEGFIGISERTVNGTLGPNEANAAAKSPLGAPTMFRLQLDALRLYEKGTERTREHVAKILNLGAPDSKVLESPATKG